MSYQPIENYGIIGNMRTVAIVGMNGSIDWYCYPHFDSPSIFGALLDDEKGGRFQISPIGEGVRHKQFYWPSTNILITRFLLPDGIAELEDFMPVGLLPDSPWYHHLFHRIRCVRGAVRMSLICRPAFDYGRKGHQVSLQPNGAFFKSSGLSLALSTAVPLSQAEQGVTTEFLLEEGKSEGFLLKAHRGDDDVSVHEEAEELFQGTVKFWQNWLSASTYRGRWREQVQRSALALKLLTFEPTGAMSSLPPPVCPRSSPARATGIIATCGCATPPLQFTLFSESDSEMRRLDS
jgi:GH15 family glucan-1,4-alpha-glucosidase